MSVLTKAARRKFAAHPPVILKERPLLPRMKDLNRRSPFPLPLFHIFAPLGAPLLAVADGTVFSVGWNDVGGWRLWLRDRKGNEFYYAHLSAYTTLARNGAHVKAGQVLGFVGNTGDAQGTPFHLHFEVHPVSMLFLGYDGAVNPTKYLDAWKRLDDVRILPAVPFSQPQAEVSKQRARARRDPSPGERHLDRERPRPRRRSSARCAASRRST